VLDCRGDFAAVEALGDGAYGAHVSTRIVTCAVGRARRSTCDTTESPIELCDGAAQKNGIAQKEKARRGPGCSFADLSIDVVGSLHFASFAI
jgi:hypothetical protein